MHHDEFALSKDTTVSVWIDFRKFYGEDSLREVCNGDFVIVNECLHSEFDKFRQKLFSILNGHTTIKATALAYEHLDESLQSITEVRTCPWWNLLPDIPI